MDYAFTHKGKAFTPNGTEIAADDASAHNAALEAQELAQWAAKPEKFCGYIADGNKFTTWTGKYLGYVLSANTTRNNLTGTKITHVRVQGNNGAIYHGKYGSDWSQLVRLTRCK